MEIVYQDGCRGYLSPPVGKFHDDSRAKLGLLSGCGSFKEVGLKGKITGEFLLWQCERSAVFKGT